MKKLIVATVAVLLVLSGTGRAASPTRQRGFETFTFASAEGVSQTRSVPFAVPFAKKPGVLLSINNTNSNSVVTWAQNVQPDGFDLAFMEFNGAFGAFRHVTVYWEARV